MKTRRVVTRASDDGTFQKGDHIILNNDGSITCIEAQGWINADEVGKATKGMWSAPDEAWRKKCKNRLLEKLRILEGEDT